MSNVQLNSPVATDGSISNATPLSTDVVNNESPTTMTMPALTESNLDIIQDMIDLSANHLEGLRTQCATSVSLTQQEIRSLESKLVRYFSELLLTKAKLNERVPARGLPHKTGSDLHQWLRVVGLSHESLNVCMSRLTTLEQLLDQSDEELKQMLCNNPCYREEEVRRLTKAMSNLRKCKESLTSGVSGFDGREQVSEQWFWDSYDRHHHVHRGSIGNIGVTLASPRAHHRQHQKQSKASGDAIKSDRQSPPNNENQVTIKSSDLGNSVKGSTLTLTLTPSPPNSPYTPSSVGGGSTGGMASVKSTPQRTKTAGTPPPTKKHQTLLNNSPLTHVVSIVQEPTFDKTELTQSFTLPNEVTPRSRLPTDPSPDNYSIASSDIFVEHNNNSNMLHVPCSPGAGHVGMGHAISHRFTTVIKIMAACNLCQKQMFIGLKCKDCKYRCHKDCEPNVPPSCGLPREYIDEFKQSFIKEQVAFSTLPHTANSGSPNLKKNTLTKPRQHADSSSPSSSCTSSTPSSPALFHLQQQHLNMAGSYMTGNSVMCSSAGGSSSTNSSILLPTPSAFHKPQSSQFNFPDVTITTSNSNSTALSGNNTQTILYASQMQTIESNPMQGSVESTATSVQQNVNVSSNASVTSSGNHSTQQHNSNVTGGLQHSNTNSVGTGSQVSTHSSNASTFTSSLVSTGTGTFYPRKLSSAGVDKRIPFTSELSDTHKSNDSDKTVSLSGSTSASTDSDRTPVRLDSTEDGDSGNWPRQNSLSLKEWDIPYGDLRLLEQIGKGRFGTVHRALWHGDVAVKLLKEDYLDDEHMLEAFKLEVANFKKTRHENLVLFMGACMNPPYLAIVTSLCKGNTLYTYIHQRREKFAINRTLLIAQQIAQGMGYLHARGIVHKDLRTKNIFIENGKVIITDFGLFSSTKLFYCDIGLGIPQYWLCYIAPELMRALMPRKPTDECLPFSPSSDVYSFGTVWYELICGEFTFKDQPAESIIWQVGRGMKQTLANLQSGRDVKDLLMLCWSYEAEIRPDFARLLQLLEHLPKKRLARSPSHPVNLSRSAESVF